MHDPFSLAPVKPGETIERGVLPDGTPYRVWRRWDGWTRAFLQLPSGREVRRSMGWLRKTLRDRE